MEKTEKKKLFLYLSEINSTWDGSYDSLVECHEILCTAAEDKDVTVAGYSSLVNFLMALR